MHPLYKLVIIFFLIQLSHQESHVEEEHLLEAIVQSANAYHGPTVVVLDGFVKHQVREHEEVEAYHADYELF